MVAILAIPLFILPFIACDVDEITAPYISNPDGVGARWVRSETYYNIIYTMARSGFP